MTATRTRTPKLALALILALIPALAHAQPKIFFANDYGAKPDSTTLNTAAIQKAIDAAAAANGTITLTTKVPEDKGLPHFSFEQISGRFSPVLKGRGFSRAESLHKSLGFSPGGN